MSDMPKEIWAIHVWIDDATWYECFVPGTEKYIRADIHEVRIKELEDALSWYEQTVREFATATDQRAYVEGLQRLSDRSSLASRLTKKQTEMIESDSPFEIFDQAHKALAKQHKENET